MAASKSQRIAKSAVDWIAFKERVPAEQLESFLAFKTKSDKFVNAVHMYPEELPKIDFAQYKELLPDPALVDKFQKGYEGISVPYPVDKDKVLQKVEADQKKAKAVSEAFIKARDCEIMGAQILLKRIGLIPKPEEMTLEMFSYYFPDDALDPYERPTFWPHTPEVQPDHPDARLIN